MTLLILGIALFVLGHFFKRLAPGARASMGNAGKGIVTVILLAGLVGMIFGYRSMDEIPVYDPPSWGVGVNNLLMLVAIILFGTGSSKSSLRSYIRHPMLMGALTWAVAHLLANGDLASIVLFGSIGVWAIVQSLLINARGPAYERWEGGTNAGSVRLLLIAFILYMALAFAHTYLGYWPFG
jgi:uncharacterized membrane protein